MEHQVLQVANLEAQFPGQPNRLQLDWHNPLSSPAGNVELLWDVFRGDRFFR
jgi:hypothetical protein